VLLAASPGVEGVTGRYYEDCAEAPVVHEREGHAGGVAPYVLDPDNAERLWQISEQLTPINTRGAALHQSAVDFQGQSQFDDIARA